MSRGSILVMLVASSTVSAADFSLTIGSPVAAGVATKVKSSVFAVRLEQCENISQSKITATAEGMVDGARKRLPVQLIATASPNVFVVPEVWGDDGAWVVNLKATCADAKAGAIVPTRGGSFIRESSKTFTRFATAAEVDASLKALAGGAK